MGRKNRLSEEQKIRIADLYQNFNLTPSAIAKILGYHRNTVNQYKNYRSTSPIEKKQYSSVSGECPHCRSSDNVIKQGPETTKIGVKQRFKCKKCNKKFHIYIERFKVEKEVPSKEEDIEIKPIVEEEFQSNEHDLLQKIYEKYSGRLGDSIHFRPHNEIYKWIKKDYWRQLSKLPRYENRDIMEAINELIDILEKNHQNRNYNFRWDSF